MRITPPLVSSVWALLLFGLGWSSLAYGQGIIRVNVLVEAGYTPLRQQLALRSALSDDLQSRQGQPDALSGIAPLIRVEQATALPGQPASASWMEHPVNRWFQLTFADRDSQVLANALAKVPGVAAVEPVRRFRLNQLTQTNGVSAQMPNDPLFGQQWFHERVGTLQAWDSTRGNANLLIGLLDTGIDPAHPELEGQFAFNPAEDKAPFGILTDTDFDGVDDDGNGLVDDVAGYNFVQRFPLADGYVIAPSGHIQDDNGHGTSIGGVMVGRADNQEGGAGIAPGCKLLVLKAFGADGTGLDLDIARAIVYGTQRGMRILNCSFGDIYPSGMMQAAIRYATQQGVIIVASAGNGTGQQPHYPSDFPEVISVSATDYNPNTGREFLWPLSSYGPRVALAAPGGNLLAPTLTDSSGQPRYGTFSGTSLSAGIVSGAVGLILSQRPNLNGANIRSLLAGSADDIPPTGPDNFTGSGRLNIGRALKAEGNPLVYLSYPSNDSGTSAFIVPIVGTVLHPEMQSWSLYWEPGPTILETNWNPLRTGVTQAVLDDTLFVWNLTGMPDNIYQLRLSVLLQSGRTVEHRIRFYLDRSAPKLDLKFNENVWENGVRKHYMAWRSNDIATFEVMVRNTQGGNWQRHAIDRTVRNGELLLGPESLQAGAYEWQVRASNSSGLTTLSPTYTFDYEPVVLDTTGFEFANLSGPAGLFVEGTHLLNGKPTQILAPRSNTGALGRTAYYQLNGGRLQEVARTTDPPNQLPRSLAPFLPGTPQTLLVGYGDTLWLYGGSPYPTTVRLRDETNKVFVSRLADTDGDGQAELLAKDFNDFFILKLNAQGKLTKTTLLNDTLVSYTGSTPRTVVGDIDGDGKPEIVTGDYRGKIIVYEQGLNGSFRPVFSYVTGLEEIGNLLAMGDFNGNGKPEFFVAGHTSTLRNADFEYGPRYWRCLIFESDGLDSYELVWEDYIYNVENLTFNSTLAANLDNDPADELLISIFPSTYLLEYSLGDYRLTRYRFGTAGQSLWAGDIDADGRVEFTLPVGDSTFYYRLGSGSATGNIALRLKGTVTGPTATRLEWNPLPNVLRYDVYRGIVSGGQSNLTRIAQPLNPGWNDNSLQAGQTYVYQVIPITGPPPTEGTESNFVLLMPHARPKLDSVRVLNARQLLLHFSHFVEDRVSDLPFFRLQDGNGPSSLLKVGTQSLLLDFTKPFRPGKHLLTVDTLWQDRDKAHLLPGYDTASFVYNPQKARQLYLTQWLALTATDALLRFNLPLEVSALNPNAYQVRPYGRVVAIAPVTNDPNAVQLQLEGIRLGALGQPVSIHVNNSVTALSGERVVEGQGDVATFVETASSLDEVFVYPNPVKPNPYFVGCRFANLMSRSVVQIYTPNGLLVRSLNEDDGDGGLEWDLRDQSGRYVNPGLYIYEVQGPNGASGRGRFTIVDR